MNTIVVYYSNKGSNKFLAEKIATDLQCDIVKIEPRINKFFMVLMNLYLGIKPIKINFENYERVILCGPIWFGAMNSPLRLFIKKYINKINKLVYVSCCGSFFEKKDEKYGHGLVFNNLKTKLEDKLDFCLAFPINIVLPDDIKFNDDIIMKTRLNADNFKGNALELYNNLLLKLT